MNETPSTGQRMPQGTVTIAPAVLTTIVRMTALAEPGVLRLSSRAPAAIGRVLNRAAMAEGLRIEVHDDQTVTVELHVAADPNVNLKALGESLQNRVARAVEHMVGMGVRAVNVFIDEIEFGGAAR